MAGQEHKGTIPKEQPDNHAGELQAEKTLEHILGHLIISVLYKDNDNKDFIDVIFDEIDRLPTEYHKLYLNDTDLRNIEKYRKSIKAIFLFYAFDLTAKGLDVKRLYDKFLGSLEEHLYDEKTRAPVPEMRYHPHKILIDAYHHCIRKTNR
ncbi:MAG: hypothetical protein ABIG89_06660 [Candidatus Woesearchaeota archaeon]